MTKQELDHYKSLSQHYNSLVDITTYYNNNADFHEYVTKFCAKHRTVPETAFKSSIVQEVYRDYVRREQNA